MYTKSLKQMGLEMVLSQQKRLECFMELLYKWNEAYNLTAIKSSDSVTHHILDSLSVAPYLRGDRILDVGTGAGFPGVPLACYYPEKTFTLLDSNGKKTRFLLQAQALLGLDNIRVVQSRVESYHTQDCFDAIIFRAVRPIPEVIEKTQRLCCKGGCYLAMKGYYPTEELKAVKQPLKVHRLDVPGLCAERHLVIIQGASSD